MPYAETALLDSVGARKSHGEMINHYTGVTLRVQGSGNLDMQIQSQEEIRTKNFVPLVMATNTDIQPTQITNFNAQRAKLRISVNEINEYFQISRIIVWVKPTDSMFPR